MELVDHQSTARHLDRVRKLADDPAITPRKGRSRVTNGKSMFVEFDGRGPWTRRFRDIFDQIIDDISPPDNGRLSEGQRQLARRAATLSITCEKLEGKAAAGEDIDLELFGRITDRLGRTFQRLGLKRTSSNNGPSFGDLIRQDQAEQRRRLALEREQQHGGQHD